MKTLTNRDFGELYKKYGPMVLRRCRSILKDEEKALDAMQDVFLRIIDSRTKIKDACASLFYVTATRVCLNKIRSDKLRSGPDFDLVCDTVADDNSETEREKIEAGMLLEKIFSGRDSKDALIATLHFVDSLTLEETAEEVGMSVSGVRKRISELKKYSSRFKSSLAF
jgi:RNA polymerase sigma-70 factor (ECF subfamily)